MARKSQSEELPLDYYDGEDDEEMLEDDEITPAEAAFMEGYERGETVECANCSEEIEKEFAIKKVIRGKTKHFCSEECLEEFLESLEEEELSE